MKKRYLNLAWVVTLLMIIAAGIGGFFAGAILAPNEAAYATYEVAYERDARLLPETADTEEQLVAHIYDEVGPSVVHITSLTGISGGEGSGFVIDMSGHIVTNAHVVNGAEEIFVDFFDGTMTRAEIVGVDLDSDIAVIKVDVPAELLNPVSFADSDAVFVGQRAIAIGNPFGQSWTITTGIVSALDRTLSTETAYQIPSVIQTDAAINPGNSGGPLLDKVGRVIGVNSQIMSRSGSFSGIGFAVPANLVQRVAQSLIETGEYAYAWLGISGTGLTLPLNEAAGLDLDQRGVLVTSVTPNGPADNAGMRGPDDETEEGLPTGGDVIVAFNGEPVADMTDIIAAVVEAEPGQTVPAKVLRANGQIVDLQITLAARPE